jgi:ABC-type lipoprotein release transport system permease subunit
MAGTRSIKIFRDITARKTRTALVSLSIFVGVLGVVVLTTLGQLVTRQLEKDLVPAEMAMLRIYVEAPIGTQVDNAAVLERLRAYPGATIIEGQAVYEFRWKLPGQTDFQTGQLFAYSEPFGQIRLEPIRLVAGHYPVEGRNEIAIERRMAKRHGLKIGDTLVVRLNGGSEQAMRIVGLVFQPYLYVGGDDGTASAYVTYADAQRTVGFAGYSSIYARFKDFATARQQSHSFREALMAQTPYQIVFYLVNDPQHNIFLLGIRQITRVLVILALVAMTVASFLVTTVISTVVAEQHAQIGAMKALGATRGDILRIYLGMAFTYGLIGTIPAVLLGVPVGQQAALAAAPIANTFLDDISPPPLALILGVILGLGVPVLAAVIPVYHGSRVTILEAITDQGIPATYGKGLLPTLVRVLRLPIPLAQALNNIVRHKARLALSLLALTLAVAAFMGVFAVFETLQNVVSQIKTTLNYQISVDPANIDMIDLMQNLLLDEQIREIQPGVAVQLEVERSEPEALPEKGAAPSGVSYLYVTGLDPETDLLNVILVEGTGWNGDPTQAGIVITPRMAEEFGKTVGDMLRLISPEKTADFEIIGIAGFPLETAFMEWHQLADFVGVIRDAPIPNAYWEQVQVQSAVHEKPFEETGVWAVGIDERAGRLLVPGFSADQPGVIISQALAEAGGFKKGQAITLLPNDVSLLDVLVEDPSVTYPILAIVKVEPQQLRIIARDLPPAVLEADKPALVALFWSDLTSLVHLDYREVSPETFYIDLANPEASVNGTNSAVTAPIPAYQNQVAFEDRIAQMILSLGMVMGAASLLMAAVGSFGLLTVTSIGVFERQREIGVMRSVGASSRTILTQFLLEGLLTGIIAWLAGLPLSYVLSVILIDSVPFSDVIAFEYTLLAPIIGLAGMLLAIGLATLYPSVTATRKTVSQILHYQ